MLLMLIAPVLFAVPMFLTGCGGTGPAGPQGPQGPTGPACECDVECLDCLTQDELFKVIGLVWGFAEEIRLLDEEASLLEPTDMFLIRSDVQNLRTRINESSDEVRLLLASINLDRLEYLEGLVS